MTDLATSEAPFETEKTVSDIGAESWWERTRAYLRWAYSDETDEELERFVGEW